nr:hypothetical protein [Tanacetum cinerariifolium]
PRKRFKDSISPEDSVEEDIDTDVLEDIKANATAVEVAVRDVKAGVDACIDMEIDVGVDVKDEVKNEVESSDRGTVKVGLDMIARIDIPDGMLMPDAVEHLEQVEEDTIDADSSTPPIFVHPSLARTPWCSEAYLRWRSAPLSTMYPLTTSESPTEDSSFESSVRPSYKRCRSLTATMTSSIHATRALVPSCADLLPPRKRIEDIETGQRELEARSMIAGGKRASLLDQVASLERSNVRLRVTMMMEIERAGRFQRRVRFMESELRT